MIDAIFNNIYYIMGALLLASFAGYVTYRNNRKNRAAEAANKFRNKVLAELEGLYPVTHHWDKGIFPLFCQSITKIESAAADFRHFVPFYRKGAFDTEVKKYCEYCQRITWNEVAAYSLYKNTMYKADDKGPRGKFKLIVESLLSFAKEK